MKKFDWTSTVATNFWVLKCVGLWPESDKLYEFNFYTFYSVFNAIAIIGLHNLSQIINVFFIYKDLQALAATFFILITNMLAVMKMYFFARNLKVMKNIMVMLKSDDFQPKSEDQIKLVQPSLKRWKVSYILYCGMVANNLIMWVLMPLMSEGYGLPFIAWYPFNFKTSPNYGIVYIYQVVCFMYITAANINLDTMTYALLVFIGTQCELLCDDLSNLDGKPLEFNQKLIQCVKHHKKIVSFAQQSNTVFNMIILGQFATSTLVLALTMFQLSLTETLDGAVLVNFGYIFGLTVQLLLYCWFGNEVEIKSSQIPYAVYQSQWIDQTVNVKRNLLILSVRCQEPIKITAINLFSLSLDTFVTILRSAWSYFAVLYKINNQEVK